ncbi:endonuclease MutS2 [Parablautia sp. Marseille-Q6255]|uniref:endonuclease MutS2 n=1 Tax=Parablautia sp. Marseille-Q6255 TaxID=3039593 RepID=UPI0024BCABEE|nr:endonuclease MutS2 [Parablautia sp. Marseille-Q6255]
MNEKALKVLEYHKIIQKLTDFAGSQPGKALCRGLVPSSDISEIRRMQRETSDATARLYRKGTISFSGLSDIRGSLKRLEVGSSLNIEELLRVCSLLETTNRVKSWARSDNSQIVNNEEQTEDSLEQMFTDLQPLTPLASEIRRCILSEEEISDDASPGLRQVRRSMRLTNDKIRTQLASYVNGSTRNYLQDAVITQRNGRFCIPVKAEYRGQVPGMIHDQSSTGSTLFVEPMSIVKLNNDLRELEIKEEKEIEIVLSTLSGLVAEQTEPLNYNVLLLTELDFIFARAQLSRSYNGTEPDFNTDGRINIKKGRHPLLDPKKVVPVDIRLGDDFSLLVISGPNTGGKTVSLKTVGLFTLLGQAGLHIPAFDHSELSVFTEVYADIGDEQSIEQSLSTFSSHMTNIVSFWEQADEHSLVLFDELGAGTDPTEGAALAIAILSNLHRRGIRTIATTHYSELKVFALSTPGVQNGSCEFNVETLRPTYRLLIGVPGKSNAFAISQKLGLPDYVIEEARGHISQEDESFEDVISDLEESRATIEKEQEEINRYKQEIETLKQRLERKEDRLEASREAILQKAREEAQTILREAKEFADESIRKYNKLGKESDASRQMEQERAKLREKMSGLEKNIGVKAAKKPKKELTAKDLRIGDRVKVLSMNLTGTVSTLPDARGNLFVQMGILRSQVKLSDLEKLPDEPSPYSARTNLSSGTRSGSSKVKMAKSYSISAEINLLGRTTDEAIAELDKYLDDAYIAHLSPVRIVHGKGSGALRKAVHQYLRRQKHVASYRLGEFGEGDAGVTIVEFK